jgi:hypothetical protein
VRSRGIGGLTCPRMTPSSVRCAGWRRRESCSASARRVAGRAQTRGIYRKLGVSTGEELLAQAAELDLDASATSASSRG